LKIAVL